MPRTMLIAAIAISAGFLLGGCEQRVVRTNNSWIGSQYELAEKDRIGVMQPEKKGPLESIGEFLFGWMDGGNDGPRVGDVRDVDPNQRMERPKQNTGGGLAR